MVAVRDNPIQRKLIPSPTGDSRLLDPGWAGELAPDELQFLQVELSRDKKLAFKWGFRPGARRRPEWAIRQAAMWGDPDSRSTNVALARRQMASASNSNPRFAPKDISWGKAHRGIFGARR